MYKKVKIGDRFGKLVTVARGPVDLHGARTWSCRCDCGGEKNVATYDLNSGAVKSCGCLPRGPKPGEAPRIHGLSHTPLHRIWSQMKNRCSNPRHRSWKNYGGRGIKVCERWQKSFQAFLDDVGPRPSARHTLDRKDNDGDYEPGNVRWATYKEQRANQRKPQRERRRPVGPSEGSFEWRGKRRRS